MQAEVMVRDEASFLQEKATPPSSEFKRGAQQLRDALARLEQAVSQNTVRNVGGAVIDELTTENHQLHQSLSASQQKISTLETELEDMTEQNRTVSSQVSALSKRLEVLTDRLGTLLAD